MASKKSIDLAESLRKKISSLDTTRRRVDKLYLEKRIFTKDIEHFYEGMFLKVITSFESFIEELFIGLLHEKYKLPSRKKVAKTLFNDKDIAKEIILHGQKYVDWLPYDKLEKRASIFYHDGVPFSTLNPAEKGYLTQAMTIRNAIAHKSPYSDKKFHDQIIAHASGLPISHQSPAGYLRYVYRTGPDQTKFENYMIELLAIATKFSIHR
jgi:hypothetical protein